MPLPLEIDVNRIPLLRIVAALVARLPVDGVLTRRAYLAILLLLRPAESSVRRLVAVLAAGIVVGPSVKRAGPAGKIATGDGERLPAFPLFDPRRRVGLFETRVPGNGPGVRSFDDDNVFIPAKVAVSPDDPIDCTRLRRRLASLLAALGDLPRQARRLARALAKPGCRYSRVMRPGRPPGFCARRRHEVDDILAECQTLALLRLAEAYDTS